MGKLQDLKEEAEEEEKDVPGKYLSYLFLLSLIHVRLMENAHFKVYVTTHMFI